MLDVAGHREEEGKGRSAHEDRRATVRHRWPRVTACCAVSDRTDASWLAHVRDLSCLGVGLLLPRKLDPGTRLDLELKSLTTGTERALWARVVHAEQTPEGEWKLGCAFTGELSDDDLRRFQATRLRPEGRDTRRWVRYPCDVETACSTCLTSPGERVPTRVVDVSPSGLGLVAPCELEAGTLLHVELPATPTDPPKKVLVRIVHVSEPTNGEWFLGCEVAASEWLLGCEVADRLSDDDLQALR